MHLLWLFVWFMVGNFIQRHRKVSKNDLKLFAHNEQDLILDFTCKDRVKETPTVGVYFPIGI